MVQAGPISQEQAASVTSGSILKSGKVAATSMGSDHPNLGSQVQDKKTEQG